MQLSKSNSKLFISATCQHIIQKKCIKYFVNSLSSLLLPLKTEQHRNLPAHNPYFTLMWSDAHGILHSIHGHIYTYKCLHVVTQ